MKKPTVLITNDDGPLSDESPFIERFIATQRSWIAKAFLVNEPVVLEELVPSTDIIAKKNCWFTASGTPASCVNIALNHLFSDIDIVISGPNLGSNTANTCAMASGTLGAAMEAAIDGKRAIALSFAFFNCDISDDKAENACNIACSIISKLWESDAWTKTQAGVFNINIPLISALELPIYITRMATTQFGSLYKRLEDDKPSNIHPITGLQIKNKQADNSQLSAKQKQLRVAVDDAGAAESDNGARNRIDGEDGATYVFSASVAIETSAEENTDVWAVRKRAVSITPLQPALHSLGNAKQAYLWSQLGFNYLDE
ncbi:hypothetical protein IW139_004101 [Coemansia sp. RSA 353]|nr:hypothetical protein IW139_004101 [Coemansia sp. RSA 353]